MSDPTPRTGASARVGVRTWLMGGAVGLGLVAAIIALVLATTRGRANAETDPATKAAIESGVETYETALEALAIALPAPVVVAVDAEAESVQARLAALEDSLAQAGTRWARESQELASETQSIAAQLEDAIAAFNARVDAVQRPDGEPAWLAAITGQIAQLEDRLGKVDRRSRQNRQSLRGETGAKRRGKTVPFSAEAIDWWGDEPSVVVRTGAVTRFVARGETVAGWRLVGVDRSARRAAFIRGDERATLEVKP